MRNKIKTIAFDADDTLWVNETYFQEAERQFCALLSAYLPAEAAARELFHTEMKNLAIYGYGIKGVMLSMIETASRVTEGKASMQLINKTIELGHELLQRPVELLHGVAETLEQLQGNYRLVMATKGDLLDQERKIKQSGLQGFFHHIEIMSNKKVENYARLLKYLNCAPENFLMLGNSIKSDVLPVLELEAFAGHVPFTTTWLHEQHDAKPEHPNFIELASIADILQHLD
ncbi:HAD family hydrolase [Longitalea arenae]|uniref:HAD family hydrolase n=1 Tax=Longitalea arenae TaxID=2812558 RepID=UPI001967088A|nr:HAD family hydrolase [Longitalea arenae]